MDKPDEKVITDLVVLFLYYVFLSFPNATTVVSIKEDIKQMLKGQSCILSSRKVLFDICMFSRALISDSMIKQTKERVHPSKTQYSLGICQVWSVFTVCLKKGWVLSYT